MEGDNKTEIPSIILGVRHLQAAMIFLAAMMSSCIRVTMNIAIVAMTDLSQDNSFNWTLQTQNIILSSISWGQIALQIPSGAIANRFGGMPSLVVCGVLDSIACLLLPAAAIYSGWQAVCVCRVIIGFAQSLQVTGMMQLMSKWLPKEERARFSSFIYCGSNVGVVIQLSLSGYIAAALGWPGIFYVAGVFQAVYTVIYILLGANSPQTSKIISEEERKYIDISLEQVKEKTRTKTPWRSILTSVPFWALLSSAAGANWGHFILITKIPSYMQRVLGVDIRSNGLLSAIPYLTLCLIAFPIGYIADYILQRKLVSTSVCRKIFNSIASFGPAMALIGLCFVPPNTAISVTILSLALGSTAGFFAGDALVYLDIAPNFASIMMGISHFITTVVSFNAPLVAGLFIEDEENPREWHNIFYLTSGIFIFTNTIFLIFGTSERQKWDLYEDDDKNKQQF